MGKTLGQVIYEHQVADGMTPEEIDLYNRALTRLSIVRSDFEWGFLHECEKNNIKPTIFRYKKYIKKQEAELFDFRKNFKEQREDSSKVST